jgi:hypothetical protein
MGYILSWTQVIRVVRLRRLTTKARQLALITRQAMMKTYPLGYAGLDGQ